MNFSHSAVISTVVFDFLKSSKCPVPEPARQWTEYRIAWVMDQFGPESVRNCPIVLPTPEFFPDPWNGTDGAAAGMFLRVCNYMHVDPNRVRLKLSGIAPHLNNGIVMETDAAGLYLGEHSITGQQAIEINRSNFSDPMGLVATIAHELCHVILMGDGYMTGDEDDNEQLTDLLTICRGMGIFGARTVLRGVVRKSESGLSAELESGAYLTPEIWGYAHAVLAWVRGEEQPKWGRHLGVNTRGAFKQGMRYLAKHGVRDRGLLE